VETDIFNLNLVNPLFVIPDKNLEPFPVPQEGSGTISCPKEGLGAVYGAGANLNAERIFCFELDAAEYLAFEPDRNRLLGSLVFGGISGAGEGSAELMAAELAAAGKVAAGLAIAEAAAGKAQIPKGRYLFAQKKEILCKEEIISLAIEIQKEALWQRLKAGRNLYLRYLFEDGSRVTQLFRPCL